MNMRSNLIASFLCLAPMMVSAQESDSTLWQWTQNASHHDAIVQVSLDGATGTGVLVRKFYDRPSGGGYIGQCITANHVVDADKGRNAIRVVYRNGKVAKDCKVAYQNSELDIAVISVWVPNDIQAAQVASERTQPGDRLEITGLGGGSKLKCCLRHFSAIAADPTDKAQIYANVSLLPGDSGGPVFNGNRELVGIISGGWFWWHDARVSDATKVDTRATWPARACNLDGITSLMEKSSSANKPVELASKQPMVELVNADISHRK